MTVVRVLLIVATAGVATVFGAGFVCGWLCRGEPDAVPDEPHETLFVVLPQRNFEPSRN